MKYSRTDIARAYVAQAGKQGTKKATKDLAALVLQQGLHAEVDQIIDDIAREYMKQEGIVEADVRTAFPLSNDLKTSLSEKVKKQTGAKTVTLHETVDSTLLGGVIITAPDMELDLSLKTKLAKLRA